MSDLSQTPTATLFKQWKSGDAPSGQAMAQRFSDWYYAVTTCRLGDAHGRQPLQRACVRFQQGILSVTTAAELTNWAHGLLLEEVRMAGGRIPGGDFPNQLTTGRSPTELLHQVAARLEAAQLRLLADAYDASVALEVVSAAAEAMGGYPFAVLHARLLLKRALRDHAGVAFTEVPEAPNLDLAPLPLYEAGRMTREAEESGFETWMLTDMRLCKDIAEFGVFSQALRAGALRGLADAPPPTPVATPSAAPSDSRSATPRPVAAPARASAEGEEFQAPKPTKGSSATIPLIAAGAVGVVGILMILVALAWIFLGLFVSDDRADGPGWSIQPEAQLAVLVAQARQMVLDGDYEAAVGLAEELLDAHPDDTEALLLVADVAPRYGHPEVGVLAALQVRELGGDVGSVEAAALYAACELDEALSSAEERLAASPQDARAHAIRGMVLEVLGRAAEADQALAHAHALRPEAYPLPFPIAADDWEPMLLRAMSQLEPEERSRLHGWDFEWAPVPSLALLRAFPQPLPPSTFAIATAEPGARPLCRLYTRNLPRGCADEAVLLERLVDALREQDEYLQDPV